MSLANLHRWVPRLILSAGIVHMLVGAIVSFPHWRDIAADGLWNAVPNDDDARMMALWFMVCGMAIFGIGLQARRFAIGTGRTLPEAGWILLALGIPVSMLEPFSGGWLLVAIGVVALLASRRDRASLPVRPLPTDNAPAQTRP